jgi:hypothetical protein
MTRVSETTATDRRQRRRKGETMNTAMMNEGLRLFTSTAAATVVIYKGLTWYGGICAKGERRWWTKERRSWLDALAVATTAYFPLAISFGVVGEKTTACLLALGFPLMVEVYVFTAFIWPSAVEFVRGWRD